MGECTATGYRVKLPFNQHTLAELLIDRSQWTRTDGEHTSGKTLSVGGGPSR
jgi:hypothetical protein